MRVFGKLMDQKWKDSLNIAAADPVGKEARLKARRLATEDIRKTEANNQCKPAETAKVTIANAEVP